MTGSFAAVVDLTETGDDTFVGPPSPDRGTRTYGGQVLAQSLAAAQRTVTDDRYVHSLHSHLLRAGTAAEPLDLQVDRVRDGRSFSQRRVAAVQNGREVMQSLVSFHVPEDGLDWEPPSVIDLPPPTSEQPYTDYSDVIEAVLPEPDRPWPGRLRPMDVRYVNPSLTLDGSPVTEPQRMWMRVHGELNDETIHDQSIQAAGLAYLADLGMNPTILLPHGYSWRDERVTEATLDHTMWFHRPVRADDWLLYEQRAESTSGGRGLANGRFYNQTGHLIATCMQEGLIRWNG